MDYDFEIYSKQDLFAWSNEVEEFLQKIQNSGHRLSANYNYDYSQCDEVTIIVDKADDKVFGISGSLRWSHNSTRLIYRWARDLDKPWKDQIYGGLSKIIVEHQLKACETPYAFMGQHGQRKHAIRKWASLAGWEVLPEKRYVKPYEQETLYQYIAYTKLSDTTEDIDVMFDKKFTS